MKALIHICHFDFKDDIRFHEEFTNSSIFETMQDIMPAFNETITKCKWRREKRACDELLSPIITGAGLCYAFNSLNSHDVYTNESVILLKHKMFVQKMKIFLY